MSERANNLTALKAGVGGGRIRTFEFTVEHDGEQTTRRFVGSGAADAAKVARAWAEVNDARIVGGPRSVK